MPMNDADFLAHIRTHYSDLLDPEWEDKDFTYFIQIGLGWQSLVLEYMDRMQAVMHEHDLIGKFYIRQIKEKLGELRIYKRPVEQIVGIDEERRDIIETAEASDEAIEAMGAIASDIAERGVRTCEICGAPGEWGSDAGWYATLCEHHWTERRERQEDGDGS